MHVPGALEGCKSFKQELNALGLSKDYSTAICFFLGERSEAVIFKGVSGTTKNEKKAESPGAHGSGKSAKRSTELESGKALFKKTRYEILVENLKEILRGLLSRDSATRKMSAFFVLSVLGVVAVFALSLTHAYQYWMKRKVSSEALQVGQNLGDFLRRQADEAKLKAGQVSLGTFTVEVKHQPGEKAAPGMMNMAEIELMAQCDSKETRDFVEAHLIEARATVVSVFTATERNELMTQEGKRRIRKFIVERLNLWLTKGKIDDVYVTKLFVN